MLRTTLVLALLATAALAGCTAGQEAQMGDGPAPPFRQVQDSGPGGPSGRGQDRNDTGNDGWRGDIRLQVDPKQGIAPVNVTIDYDVGRGTASEPNGQAKGQGKGQGNATGNSTSGNATGNATTGSQGDAEADREDLSWTLEVWRMQSSEFGRTGNASDGPPSDNSTGNSTGNGTTTGGTGSGNATGNATGNSTDDPGGEADDGDDAGMSGGDFPGGPGNLTLQVNGTWADLPGSVTQRVNATGHYKVRFTVDYGNGTLRDRTATFHVRGIQEGDPLGNETKTFEGGFLASEPLLCSGSDEHELVLNATFGLHTAAVTRLNVSLEADGAIDDYDLVLVAPNGTELASGSSLEVDGPLGAGNYTLRVDSCTAVDTSYVVTVVADYAFTATPTRAPEEEEEDA